MKRREKLTSRATPAQSNNTRASAVLDPHRLDVVRRLEAEDLGQEAQLSLERAADVLVLPEPMLLPLEKDVGVGQVVSPARLDEALRLVGRNDHVLVALEEDDGAPHLVREVDRGAFSIDIRALGIWTDQGLAGVRFELVRLLDDKLEVADPVVARAGVVEVAPGERQQSGETAGRAARDRDPARVGETLVDQMARSVDAIVDVDDAPVPVESLPVGAAVASRAAVVDVDQRQAAAGPVLVLEGIRRARRSGRPTVAMHDQGRLLSRRWLVVLVPRRVVDGVRGQAVLGWKLNRLRKAEEARFDVRRVRHLDDLLRERVEVEDEHALGEGRRAREHRSCLARHLDAAKGRVEQLDVVQLAGVEVDPAELCATRVGVDADDLVWAGERIEALSENPLRRAELGVTAAHGLVALTARAIEVPPIVAVGDEVQLARRRPFRLQHRFVVTAGNLAR